MMSAHPTIQELLYLQDDQLDAAEGAAIAAHVELCPQCQQALDRLAPFGDDLAPETPVDGGEWEPAPRPAAQWPAVEGYEILAELGHGGMGVVFKARQRRLGRVVALKMIRAGEWSSAEERQRFDREARAVGRLRHPNIVQIYEVDDVAGQPFLVLEFVEGRNLAQALDGTPWPARPAAMLVETLAWAMHYAHGQGIVHRDLKPSNVLLVEASGVPSVPKVTDFGLAKRLDQESGQTPSEAVVGTPRYMAPEQAGGRRQQVGPATDIYALGAILYELLTGRPPFLGTTPLEILEQVRTQEPVPPRQLLPNVARDLGTICLKCLEKEPTRRYASAADLAEDLERWLRGEPVRARRVGPLGRIWRWCRRKPVAAALLLSLLIGSGTSLYLWRQAVHNESQALTNLHNEQAARRDEEAAHREAENNLKMLIQLLGGSMRAIDVLFVKDLDADPWVIAALLEAEAYCRRALEKRSQDQQLRLLLSNVQTRLGHWYARRGQAGESLAYYEKSAHVFEPPPREKVWLAEYLPAAVHAYLLLGETYKRHGRLDLAQQAFETSLRLWEQLAQSPPNPEWRDNAFALGFELSMRLRQDGVPAEALRLAKKANAMLQELAREAPQDPNLFVKLSESWVQIGDAHWDLDRVEETLTAYWHAAEAQRQACTLAPAVTQYRQELGKLYLHLSVRRREDLVPAEALRRAKKANAMLQELARETPQAPDLFVKLSESWHQIGKAHWDLDQVEETLAACRQAVEAQRQACTLAPAVTPYRQELGNRYLQLGRKLCELGRRDEAAACLRDRQALWPGDSAKRAEALAELRRWAAEAGKESSPEKRRERQRYLELISHLETPRQPISMPK